ncbi:hypothetical protein RUR49_24145 [Pseudoxanthobacter sp. M-2]|uniref:hypothetical protein n=1 Tax=Pseudoxanthobacter sp. M-2 TaxID=3078754 RepID=UPI0038FD3F3C
MVDLSIFAEGTGAVPRVAWASRLVASVRDSRLALPVAAGVLVAALAFPFAARIVDAPSADVRVLVIADTGASDVAAAARLVAAPDFLRSVIHQLPDATAERLRTDLRAATVGGRLAALVPSLPSASAAVPESGRVAALADALTVRAAPGKSVLSLRVSAADADLAAEVAEAVAARYVALDAEVGGGAARLFVRGTPKRSTGLFAAILSALAAGTAAGIGLFAADLRRRRAAPAATSLPPVAGTVPIDVRVTGRGDAAAARQIAAALSLPSSGPHCLLVAGEPAAARTVAALVAEAGEAAEQTILIDLTVATAAAAGFGALLAGEASFGEAIVRRPGSYAHHLEDAPIGPVIEADGSRERFHTVLEALQQTYERVVVVLDPVARPDLLAAAAPHAAAAVFAFERGDCPPASVSAHAAISAAIRGPLVAAALAPAPEHPSLQLAA